MSIAEPAVRADAGEVRHLGGPVSDFVMLGGGTIFIYAFMLALPSETFEGPVAVFAYWLAFAINHPHFAVSYRIFYERFDEKAAGVGQTDATLRYRYLFAGLVAPVLLALALGAIVVTGSSRALGYGYNVMGFFVGWHYVKQGYGMAMVDAALKRRFLPDRAKKVLLVNGYATWAFVYSLANQSSEPFEFYGLMVHRFDFPPIVAWALGAVAVGTTAMVAAVFGRRLIERQPTAWIGISSYLVTLYMWMIIGPRYLLFLAITPALHSLQYLWVVRRFQKNRHQADPDARSWRSQYWRSVLLGASMFFIVPVLLNSFVPYDQALWGPLPFLFAFVIFINVHHYFLDNVMWRRGNDEVSRHLFA